MGQDDWFLAWEARETLFGAAERSHASDVWALATVMWEIFMNGDTPFAKEQATMIRMKVSVCGGCASLIGAAP